jgi:hypothetical protein
MIETFAWLLAAYLLICVCAYFVHRYFMYFPNPNRTPPWKLAYLGVGLSALADASSRRLRSEAAMG